MGVPSIPGYTSINDNMAGRFLRPAGNWSDELWPEEFLKLLTPTPIDWVLVCAYWTVEEGRRINVSSFLVASEDVNDALGNPSWDGTALGVAGIWEGDGKQIFDDGLRQYENRDFLSEFFVQMRSHHGLTDPTLEIHHPFAWFTDAVPRNGKLYALDPDGTEAELIRIERGPNENYKVFVLAPYLRRYLSVASRVLIQQVDYSIVASGSPDDTYSQSLRTDIVNFHWGCFEHHGLDNGASQGASRLLGKLAIQPWSKEQMNRSSDETFPAFVIGVDPITGEEVSHTCDPDQLGTYFDPPEVNLIHYLQPVYFNPQVLEKYRGEPSKYRISGNTLSCLDLWSIQVSINTEGLVEVYLGDLGTYLPNGELPQWVACNTVPRGMMDPGRFKRDFLSQFTDDRRPIEDVRFWLVKVDLAFTAYCGSPLLIPFVEPLRSEFNHLYNPISTDPSALNAPLLTLAKAIADSIDVDLLRRLTVTVDDKAQSLTLMQKWVKSVSGDTTNIMGPLFQLQDVRSKLGAHRNDVGRQKILINQGLTNLDPREQFDTICLRVAKALEHLANLVTGLTAL